MSRAVNQLIDLEPLELWEYAAIMPKLPYHWQLVYRTLWETGIRLGECLRLTKKDLVDGGIWVNRLKKRAKSQRDFIPLHTDLYSLLVAYTARIKGNRLFPFTRAGAWYILKEACKEAGVRETIHPHLFRHGFARKVAKSNLGLSPLDHMATLQQMLGHSSIKDTERYFKPGKKEVQDAWLKLSRLGS